MNTPRHIVDAAMVDEHARFSLREVCRLCGVHSQAVLDMAAEGLISPSGPNPERWVFTGVHLTRIRAASRMQRDLRVNLAGAALALELLDEVQRLRRELGRLDRNR